MLPRRRHSKVYLPGLVLKLERTAHVLDVGGLVQPHLPGLHMRIIEGFAQVLHGRPADIAALEPGLPLRQRFAGEELREKVHHRCFHRPGLALTVMHQIHAVPGLEKITHEFEFPPAKGQMTAVRRLVDPIEGCASPGALLLGDRRTFFAESRPKRVRREGQQRILHGHIQIVALPGLLTPIQRHQHARQRQHGTGHIRSRNAGIGGRVVAA